MITLLLMLVSITACYAYDCVCPKSKTFPVYVEPYTYSQDEQLVHTSQCLVAKAYYNHWYNVLIDGETGFVNEYDINIVNNCHSTLHRPERFLAIWTNLFKGAAQTMSCASVCSLCWCKNACSDTFCEPCGFLMCSKDSTTPPSKFNQFFPTSTTTKPSPKTKSPSSTTKSPSSITKSPSSTPSSASSTSSTTKIPSFTTLHQIIVSPVDPCSNNPCLNGGLCKAKGSVPECFCKSSPNLKIIYTGSRCELLINLAKANKGTTVAPWLFIPGK